MAEEKQWLRQGLSFTPTIGDSFFSLFSFFPLFVSHSLAWNELMPALSQALSPLAAPRGGEARDVLLC